MYSPASGSLPDYETLNDELIHSNSTLDASECHGLFCGMFCSAGDVDLSEWERHVFSGLDSDEMDCVNCRELMEELYAWTLHGLNSEDLDFTLLLPEDQRPLATRTDALASWSRGFVSGLGLGGFEQEQVSDEVLESLNDFVEIGKASGDPDLQDDDDSEEEEENAYMEIVEYLRVSVMNLFEELQAALRDRKVH